MLQIFLSTTAAVVKMKPRSNGVPRTQQRSKSYVGEGPNWMLIAGGALLSTLSMRFGYKLKQVLDSKQQRDNTTTTTTTNGLKGNGKPTDRTKPGYCPLHSNVFCFTQDKDTCFNCLSGTEGVVAEMKQQQVNGQLVTQPEMSLPMVTVSGPTEYNKEINGVMWASSPDRLDLPSKPFHRSNSSDSPCVSESGSDIFSKREVIQKLRQQLKRRDDMILEMQDQIAELHNSLSAQVSHSTHLQTLVDESNRDLFNSEREIQRLRKAIADHCVGQVGPTEGRNGHTNGYVDAADVEGSFEFCGGRGGGGDGERIEMLRREVGELKEVIGGKEYLLQSYKEQKSELSLKIKELQQRLDSQLPNIL